MHISFNPNAECVLPNPLSFHPPHGVSLNPWVYKWSFIVVTPLWILFARYVPVLLLPVNTDEVNAKFESFANWIA